MHPEFPEIIDDVRMLRDRYFPEAKISVLSNATQILKPRVFEALKKVDNNILKLDTVNPDYIQEVDRPNGHYNVEAIIDKLKAFEGKVIIQTMFMKGTMNGRDVSNLSDGFVQPWLKAVKDIAPEKVMIYTIDRETPDHDLKKASHEELDHIVDLLKKEGIEATASY